jgi:acetylornithine deacetylase/succinyl-diaminopimelate desuccinylase-like protein
MIGTSSFIAAPPSLDRTGGPEQHWTRYSPTCPRIAALAAGALLADFGIAEFLGGVRGLDRLKIHLFSPTCTICGMVSGSTGAGSKTVLPSEARAKIDFRLVPDMDSHEIVRLLRAHLDANGFGDITIEEFGHQRAARSDPATAVVRAMAAAMQHTYGQPAVIYPYIKTKYRVSGFLSPPRASESCIVASTGREGKARGRVAPRFCFV